MPVIDGLRQAIALYVARPYIRRELPGWGKLYALFVGTYRNDALWAGMAPRWTRGKLHGYEMLLDLARWSPRQTYFLGRFYDLGTQSILQALLNPDDLFIDIGANEGMISLLAARLVGPGGHIVAFEPNPVPRTKLEKAIARNGIRTIDLRPVGLADKDADLALSIPRVNHGEGSFGRPDYDSADMDVIVCPVRVGDVELAGSMPRLIKIDVEGFETNVLRGLPDLLARTQPFLVTEIVADHLAHADSSVAELSALMQQYGYHARAISVRRDGMAYRAVTTPLTLPQDHAGDVLWVPDSRADDPALLPLTR